MAVRHSAVSSVTSWVGDMWYSKGSRWSATKIQKDLTLVDTIKLNYIRPVFEYSFGGAPLCIIKPWKGWQQITDF